MLRLRVTELEQALHHLEDAANRREEFIASFAHELKTPLTAIIGYADMLRSKDMAPKPRFTAAGYIFSEGKRLEAMSLKLLDIIVAGKQNFEMRRFDAGYFIRSVAAVTVPSLSADGLTLNMRWENADVELEPDFSRPCLSTLWTTRARRVTKGRT
jgi:signal transduction histidine kinase